MPLLWYFAIILGVIYPIRLMQLFFKFNATIGIKRVFLAMSNLVNVSGMLLQSISLVCYSSTATFLSADETLLLFCSNPPTFAHQ